MLHSLSAPLAMAACKVTSSLCRPSTASGAGAHCAAWHATDTGSSNDWSDARAVSSAQTQRQPRLPSAITSARQLHDMPDSCPAAKASHRQLVRSAITIAAPASKLHIKALVVLS